MRILFASSEVSPFAKTGGLGDVVGALPKALRRLGHDVAVFTPFYAEARRYCESHGIALADRGGATISWGNWTHGYRVLSGALPGSDVPIFFVENQRLFDRGGLYWGREDGVDDNLERFTFFCRAVISAAERLNLKFDVVHAHDWQTALLPIYLHSGLRWTHHFYGAKSVYTIHNLNYQGRYGADRFPVLGLAPRYWRSDALEYYGDLVLMKGGILFADRVTTVSPTYAQEIQTPAFGAGFDGLLRARASALHGILNGIDDAEWNPETDPLIAEPFSARDLRGKAACKRALRRDAGLAASARTPLLVAISRLAEQKGFDLFIPLVPHLVEGGWQVAVLGTGEWELEAALHDAAKRHPESVAVWTKFDSALAHRLIAGGDAIVVPSRYEPCGLNQMYGLRYGTIPIVRATGGLVDTVEPWHGTNTSAATGFSFHHADPKALAQALLLARMAFRDRALWLEIQRNGMARDFSWNHSALEYDRLYHDLLAEAHAGR
ncbi:MAG TPA: glycogen synthase GlgA [Thermoanaerobaculia bacterium]